MAVPIEPDGSAPPAMFRVTSGLELLDRWAEKATQSEKTVVYQVLFAVVDGSVFTGYDVVDDVMKTMEFFVLCRCDLAVKIRVHDPDTCGIVYIGPACAAPGLDQAAPDPGVTEPEAEPDAEPDTHPGAGQPEQEKDAPNWI